MQSLIVVCISGISCVFQNYSSTNFWNNWQWTLDSFKVSDGCKIDLLIEAKINKQYQEALSKKQTILFEKQMGFFIWRVYLLKGGEMLCTYSRRSSGEKLLSFNVSRDWNHVILLEDFTESAGNAAFMMLAQIFPGVCLKHDLLTFHSALVEYRGKAFAVCADSGTGKTTHARLWRDCKNALILNGDRTVCGRTEGRWTAYGTPWSGSSGEQINRSAPLDALVLLERSEVNYVQCLSGLEAFRALMPHLLYPSWDAELVGRAMELMDDLLANVRIYRLGCRPDSESVEVLCQAIFKE